MPNKVSFTWRNYFRPTPKNLEYIASAIRRIVTVVAGTTIVMEANHWVPFGVLLFGAIVEEAKNFFAYVQINQDEKVIVNVPPKMEDQVIITNEENFQNGLR